MEYLNNQEKISKLNLFMKKLQEAKSSFEKRNVFDQYKEVVKSIKPIDIFYLSMYQNENEDNIDLIKDTANKFVNVFYNGLKENTPKDYDNLLFKTLIQENTQIENHLQNIKQYIKELNKNNINILKNEFTKCIEFEKKFIKLENILFPHLESKLPSNLPLKVLWSLHDDARLLLKKLLEYLNTYDIDYRKLHSLIGEYYYLVYGINLKNEVILFPVANQLLTLEVKNKLYKESLEYGYTFIDNLEDIQIQESKIEFDDLNIKTDTGTLSLKQFNLIMNYLPLDITYVDKYDKVTYFNNRPTRHFPRNPSIIGRKVENCHPPKSVEVVLNIVSEFKNNTKNSAEFWINFNDKLLYITYYAIRDSYNNYEGVLEVSQDITHIQTLKGQKHLLDWE